MLLEVRTVSRKTPNDGKLEISLRSADALRALEPHLIVVAEGRRGLGGVVSMECTCGAGGEASAVGEAGHVHHFLQSEALRGLDPETKVTLELAEDARTVIVAPR